MNPPGIFRKILQKPCSSNRLLQPCTIRTVYPHPVVNVCMVFFRIAKKFWPFSMHASNKRPNKKGHRAMQLVNYPMGTVLVPFFHF